MARGPAPRPVATPGTGGDAAGERCPGEIQDRQIDAGTGRSGHATLTGTRLPGRRRRILKAMTAASSAPGSANRPPAVGELVAVNVGLPRDVAWRGRTVHTGVWKEPVDGPRMVRYLNVDGDGQGDLAGHGGPHRAVLVYQLDSYAYWRRQLRLDDGGYGQFGENFTVEGLPDDEVCIGDRYEIGAALFEVSQPRVTCYRVGLRLGEPRLPALLVAHRRPGFYLRVLREGVVEAGDPIIRVRSGPERMTVADVDALLYLPGHDRGDDRPGAADTGAESRLARILRGPAAHRQHVDRERRAERDRGRTTRRVVGIPAGAGRGRRPRDRDGGLAPPGRPGRVGVPRGAAGAVRRAAPRPRSAAAAHRPQLLPLRGTGIARLPGEREAGTRRSGQQVRPLEPAPRRGRGDVGAARTLHPERRRDTGAAAVGRHRRHPAAVDAARAGPVRVHPRGLVAARRAQRRRARVRRRGRRPAGAAAPRPEAHLLQRADRHRPAGGGLHASRAAER